MASGSNLDLSCAPCVLYGVKYIDLVSLVLFPGPCHTPRPCYSSAPVPDVLYRIAAPAKGIRMMTARELGKLRDDLVRTGANPARRMSRFKSLKGKLSWSKKRPRILAGTVVTLARNYSVQLCAGSEAYAEVVVVSRAKGGTIGSQHGDRGWVPAANIAGAAPPLELLANMGCELNATPTIPTIPTITTSTGLVGLTACHI